MTCVALRGVRVAIAYVCIRCLLEIRLDAFFCDLDVFRDYLGLQTIQLWSCFENLTHPDL